MAKAVLDNCAALQNTKPKSVHGPNAQNKGLHRVLMAEAGEQGCFLVTAGHGVCASILIMRCI